MNIEEKVIAVLQKHLEKRPEITLESRLIEDLTVDSFDRLMIITGLEDEFEVTVDEEDFKDVVTVQDIVEKFKAHNQ